MGVHLTGHPAVAIPVGATGAGRSACTWPPGREADLLAAVLANEQPLPVAASAPPAL
ncbi:hypothetical protein I6A84_43595 [Frankia sp. CNm7]|uniref:Uncharacterized protein n=1 Tax=Frankia nepalensis TaxID=1836974 RepID=A0A937UQA2_9ACTN|nr:hypothetical protein [Frankia nepalensis]MBL7495870.1 hypothetical protein [Frankia nepalensis]MBL7510403.1 hypothetical protein [Frankia nepalensis]MBL7524748.1 hypothetical protein [Frankia nepalensis]MBL7630002.1 hypothetical protein [Frankia nepalensis]